MYVITGATGNTGNVIVRRLLAAGKRVRAIGRSAERLRPFVDGGAEPFVGDVEDEATLRKAFAGAQAVYAMVPPNYKSSDYRAYQERVVGAIAASIRGAGVRHAVSLSSFGADKAAGTGPVVGLHHLEQQLNAIDGLNVLHLRAGYFMENTLGQIGAIKAMGAVAGPLRENLKLPMIATRDIGEVAADALLGLDFHGRQTRELLGQRDMTMSEAAAVIGRAIGRPGLTYKQVPDAQFRSVLAQLGFSTNVANLILEMTAALNSGHMAALEKRSARNTTPTSYETFVADEFVPRFTGAKH